MLNKVFKALRQESVGIAGVAQDMRMYPKDLEELVFNLAIVPIEGNHRAEPPELQRQPAERTLRLV